MSARSPGSRRLAATGAALAPFVALLMPSSPAGAFDAARAMDTERTIASDAFRGRFSGLDSGKKIEEYVAARFGEWGLSPGGRDGTFYYPFDMMVSEERAGALALEDTPFGEVRFLYGDEFTVCTNSGSADLTAEVVLVGHGLCSPDREWDDYADLDVRGRIALVLRGTPKNGYDWGEAGSRDSTLAEAVRRGAVGVIFVNDGNPVQGAAVHVRYPRVPSLFASPRVLEHVLMNTGWDLKRYRDAVNEKPTHLEVRKRMKIKTGVREVRDGHARDVVGILEGSDPVLRDEILVIGGHMDHVGTNGDGIVFNGANDNGSGTSVVMELARTFAASGERPKRTLVFMTFAGEEQGLLGSDAFAKDPSVPLDKAIGMLNMDMTGHGNGKVYLGGTEYFPAIRKAFLASMDSSRADSLKISRAWRGESSDHAPFARLGIPTMNLGSDGDHRFYHSLQDDPVWIDEAVIGSVGRMAEAWIRTVADWPEPLQAEHREGRTLLHGADQVDFEGTMTEASLPPWVRGSVRWFSARDFGTRAWLDTLAVLRKTAESDSGAPIVRALKDVREASKAGRRALLVGLRAAGGEEGIGVPPLRRPFLASLDVAALEWDGTAPEDSTVLDDVAMSGAFLVVPPDSSLLARLPKTAKRCIRFFPGIGERVPEPEKMPRKDLVFVLAVDGDGDLPVADLAELIRTIGRDRTHLDVVPWLHADGEGTLGPFLEELRAAGGWTWAEMTDLLGGNLARL